MMQFDMFEYTDLGNRAENEDSRICERVSPQMLFAVVADGLGGHGDGKAASQIAVDTLSQCRENGDLPSAEQVKRWLDQANQAILDSRDGPSRMKTTVVFLCVCNNQAIWAHIGDSRLYHYYNGSLVEVTQDHSMTQLAVMQGEITRNEMPQHPDRSRLIRAMGNEDFNPVIHQPVHLNRGFHAFLLCTDGFWETLQEDEIQLDLNKSKSPQAWVEYLRSRGEKRRNRRDKQSHIDNNTAAAVWVAVR